MHTRFCLLFASKTGYFVLQEQQPIFLPAMVRVQDPSTWMMFPALVPRVDLWTADTLPTTTAAILKMLVSVVEVKKVKFGLINEVNT